MANRNVTLGNARSETILESSRSVLAPQERRPTTRQEYSPLKVFTPGNAKIAPMRGPINIIDYKVPQSTLNLFYMDSIRQGIRDGLIILDGEKEGGENSCMKQQEGAGDIPIPNSRSLNSLKERSETPEERSASPEHFLTPVKEFYLSPSSESSSEEEDFGDRELRASAPFYYKDDECDSKALSEAKSRASLAEARKQFFQPLYRQIELNRHSPSPKITLDCSQSSYLS